MDFKRLGYFTQIAELGSLTKAAERFNIAQPSLSRQVRLLEEELGVALFVRRNRGMELTEAGAALNARIAGPLRQIGHALFEVRSLPSEVGGTVLFGMPPTVVQILAGTLARHVAAYAPKIRLQIIEGQTGHLLDWIRRGDLDTAILYGPTPTGVNATKLVEDELVLVGPPGSFGQDDATTEFASLADLPLILPSNRHGLRLAVETVAAKARIRLDVRTESDSFHVTKELVGSGLGHTLLPAYAVAREVAKHSLATSRLRNPNIHRQLYLVMQARSNSPRAVLQIEEFVRHEVQSLVSDGRWPAARVADRGS